MNRTTVEMSWSLLHQEAPSLARHPKLGEESVHLQPHYKWSGIQDSSWVCGTKAGGVQITCAQSIYGTSDHSKNKLNYCAHTHSYLSPSGQRVRVKVDQCRCYQIQIWSLSPHPTCHAMTAPTVRLGCKLPKIDSVVITGAALKDNRLIISLLGCKLQWAIPSSWIELYCNCIISPHFVKCCANWHYINPK